MTTSRTPIATLPYDNNDNDKINNEQIIEEGRSRNHSLIVFIILFNYLYGAGVVAGICTSTRIIALYVLFMFVLLMSVLVLVQTLKLLHRSCTSAGTSCHWW